MTKLEVYQLKELAEDLMVCAEGMFCDTPGDETADVKDSIAALHNLHWHYRRIKLCMENLWSQWPKEGE